MEKITMNPGTLLYPVPAVMVSCGSYEGKANIITIAWVGTICSEPPMLSISVRPERYSHALIMDSLEFVVNIPHIDLSFATDLCGVKSGREIDKFTAAGLTKGKGISVSAPIINECPINLECVVKNTIKLGSHDMFIAEITAVQGNADIAANNGRLDLKGTPLFSYAANEYYRLGESIGQHGFSLEGK
jgi:flavin reductase (DIM6/NTAB) family NADH-FMN oxidoreductase RutF